jgi:hypothetical protein
LGWGEREGLWRQTATAPHGRLAPRPNPAKSSLDLVPGGECVFSHLPCG